MLITSSRHVFRRILKSAELRFRTQRRSGNKKANFIAKQEAKKQNMGFKPMLEIFKIIKSRADL